MNLAINNTNIIRNDQTNQAILEFRSIPRLKVLKDNISIEIFALKLKHQEPTAKFKSKDGISQLYVTWQQKYHRHYAYVEILVGIHQMWLHWQVRTADNHVLIQQKTVDMLQEIG